jgi:hypothetical protein
LGAAITLVWDGLKSPVKARAELEQEATMSLQVALGPVQVVPLLSFTPYTSKFWPGVNLKVIVLLVAVTVVDEPLLCVTVYLSPTTALHTVRVALPSPPHNGAGVVVTMGLGGAMQHTLLATGAVKV